MQFGDHTLQFWTFLLLSIFNCVLKIVEVEKRTLFPLQYKFQNEYAFPDRMIEGVRSLMDKSQNNFDILRSISRQWS